MPWIAMPSPPPPGHLSPNKLFSPRLHGRNNKEFLTVFSSSTVRIDLRSDCWVSVVALIHIYLISITTAKEPLSSCFTAMKIEVQRDYNLPRSRQSKNSGCVCLKILDHSLGLFPILSPLTQLLSQQSLPTLVSSPLPPNMLTTRILQRI
jgi:hypothetical protein